LKNKSDILLLRFFTSKPFLEARLLEQTMLLSFWRSPRPKNKVLVWKFWIKLRIN